MMNFTPKDKSRKRRQNAEINITPMVDVMLVLLIVFMVTAPLMTVGVPVELPETDAKAIRTDDKAPVVVTVQKDGVIYLQNNNIVLARLIPEIQKLAIKNPDMKIFVRGDKNVAYGVVLNIMGRISAAGFKKVALITEQLQ